MSSNQPLQPITTSFFVKGMKCGRCVFRIEEALLSSGLVTEARVNLSEGRLNIKSERALEANQVLQIVQPLGFEVAQIANESELIEKNQADFRQHYLKLGVAAACSGNIMILAIAVYSGADPFWAHIFDWLSFVLFLPVLFFSGQEFFLNSYYAIKARRASVDLPIALAIGLGGMLSTYHLIMGQGEVYFDSMAALIFLLLASRLYLKKVQQKYLSPIYLESFLKIQKVNRWCSVQKNWIEVSWGDLNPGDRILVPVGEKIPADGVLLSEISYLNTSLLTGESLPQKVLKNSPVFAGTSVETFPAEVLVEKTQQSTRIGKILRSLQQEVMNKTPLVSFTDRFAQTFTIVVLATGSVFLLAYSFVDFNEAIRRALALSLVSCPCALVFATPLAQSFALMKAAKKGYFFKKASALEKLTQVKTIIFDKTGTLTQGQIQLAQFWPEPPGAEIASILMALENPSQHPIAQAVKRAVEGYATENHHVSAWKETPGKGVQAEIDGNFYELVAAQKFRGPTQSYLSWNVLKKNHEPILWMGFGDEIKLDSEALTQILRKANYRLILASGDQPKPVEALGSQLGFRSDEIFAELSPEKKRDLVEKHPFALMIGDGHNDALALAKAHVGVAVHGSMETSLKAADIYLTQPGVQPIQDLIRLSKETTKVVKRSLIFSLCYNLVAGSAALFGLINPLIAAILMPISSFIVLTHAWVGTAWLRRFDRIPAKDASTGDLPSNVHNILNTTQQTEESS